MEINKKFLDNITDFIFPEDAPASADIIFIPGDGYPQMAERAARLWKQGYAPRILPSGRYSVLQGSFAGVKDKQEVYGDDYKTEWEFLCHVLTSHGVPREVILREEAATYTYENAIYSRQVTDHAGLTIRRGIICCKSFHARRCKMYYQLLYPETEFYLCPVQVQGIARDTWHQSREGIETVLGEAGRCAGQFREILLTGKYITGP
ncbi:YdcF family protein [Lactonifactor longoviformis]|uniref:DUF218 domain-containing protein n=1 Tax=Lactonifactor longoviformis DSM 17459 TaxID=1122155 RepID=A0A1M4XK03_9CLOT|nr:DUF218 domain-containing protein [Lactonifactor longoviformis DSM 17459]